MTMQVNDFSGAVYNATSLYMGVFNNMYMCKFFVATK